jgi:hypothetical protein
MAAFERLRTQRFFGRRLDDWGLVATFKTRATKDRIVKRRTASIGVAGTMMHGQK